MKKQLGYDFDSHIKTLEQLARNLINDNQDAEVIDEATQVLEIIPYNLNSLREYELKRKTISVKERKFLIWGVEHELSNLYSMIGEDDKIDCLLKEYP